MVTYVKKYANAYTCDCAASCNAGSLLTPCPFTNPQNALGEADNVYASVSAYPTCMYLEFADYVEIPVDAVIDEVWIGVKGYSSKRNGEPLEVWIDVCRNGVNKRTFNYIFQMPYNVNTWLYWSWTTYGDGSPFLRSDFNAGTPFAVYVRFASGSGGTGKNYPRTLYLDSVFLEIGYHVPSAVVSKPLMDGFVLVS